MVIDWGLLGQNTKAMLQGLQKSPWTFDPSQLTGDATENRARIYSGSATTPRDPSLAPGSFVPTPGEYAGGPLEALPPLQPAQLSPLQPAASAVPQMQTPTSALAQAVQQAPAAAPAQQTMQPQQTAAPTPQGVPPQAGQAADPNAPKDDFSAFSWFDPENVAKKFNDPAWQRNLNAATFGSNGSGQQMPAGIMLSAGMQPPTSKDGQFYVSGFAPGGVDSGEGGMTAGRTTYGYMPNAPQIPPELQDMVAQYLASKPEGKPNG